MLSPVTLGAVGKYPVPGWVAAVTRDLLTVSFQWRLEQKRPALSQRERLCSAGG